MQSHIYDAILKLEGKNYESQYSEIKDISDKHKLLKFQETHIMNLILHAYKNVPYYRRILKEAGIANNETITIQKFEKIPMLTKEIIGNKNLASTDYTTRRWYYNYSGGSTGEPTRFIQDENYGKWFKATSKYYYKDMLGIDEVSAKKVILWGSPRDIFKGNVGLKAKISNWLENTTFLNSFRMTKEDMQGYIKIINTHKPDLIRGYAGSLYELCKYAEEAGLSIYAPKILVSSAETLLDKMREKIETVFRTKIYDFYGSRETASLAGECQCGLMHIFTFNNYIEILDDHNQPVKEGEMGKVVVTNLHNYSMPFIRYEIGDAAVLGSKKCKCGNMLPTLEKVAGRVEEQFVREDGGIVIGYFFVHLLGVVRNKGHIKKFQVIQEDYKRIKILIIPEGVMDKLEKKSIEDKIRAVMGKDCKIIWDFVEDIPKTKSGKYLYTKSLVKR